VLLAIPLGIVMALFWVAVPAATMERLGPGQALTRSKNLTRGNMMASFWIVALPVIVGFGAGLLVEATAKQGATTVGDGFFVYEVPVYDRLQVALAPLALQVLVLGPITAVAAAVGYHDLRVAQDGVSLDELAKVFE